MIGALEKRDKQRESVGEAECCERGVFCSFMTFENGSLCTCFTGSECE